MTSSASNYTRGMSEGEEVSLTDQCGGTGVPRRSPLPDQEAARVNERIAMHSSTSPVPSSDGNVTESAFSRPTSLYVQHPTADSQDGGTVGDSRRSQERIPLRSNEVERTGDAPYQPPGRSALAGLRPRLGSATMVGEAVASIATAVGKAGRSWQNELQQSHVKEDDLLSWTPDDGDHKNLQQQPSSHVVSQLPHSSARRLRDANSHISETIRYELEASDDTLVADFDKEYRAPTGSSSPPFDVRQRALSEPEVRDSGQHRHILPQSNVLRQRKRSGGAMNKGSSNITDVSVPLHQHPLRSRAFTTDSASRAIALSSRTNDHTFDLQRPHLEPTEAGGGGSTMNRSQSNNSLLHAATQALPAMMPSPLMSTLDASLMDHLLPLSSLDDSPVPAFVAVSDSDGEATSRRSSNHADQYRVHLRRYPQQHAVSMSSRISPPRSFNAGRPPRAPPSSEQNSSQNRNTIDAISQVSAPGTTARLTSRPPTSSNAEIDRERLARIRWIRINRRFQLVISSVAFLFSLLLFAILVCWVFLTSAYVMSFDKACDVPLKRYYWLVTLQLVLDVFRSDIMRFIFRWDARSNERIPGRVVAYNIVYLIFALLVLRRGIRSVFLLEDTDPVDSCRSTAPDLFKACTAFVSLSIAAWSVIILGYLVPFCVVAAMLTLNGYNPNTATLASDVGGNTTTSGTVFPSAYATTGAPPSCVDQLAVLPPLDTPDGSYPGECCICMENFRSQDVVVETACRHIFHKSCCREWLRQARTCPVCRDDIPSACDGSTLSNNELAEHHTLTNESGLSAPNSGSTEPISIPIGPSGRPVAGLLRVLRRATSRFFHDTNVIGGGATRPNHTTAVESVVTIAAPSSLRVPGDVEAGRQQFQN